ncbi:AEC family transporter [Motiliproteus sediminis]|uniref:AEC family transporter n=1 Tax=Motiliproteus sediminis TaxID=1468178 RepID=UPI001AF01F66|nr:AEC family transporter [Motiliproteus sediminis]
MSSFQPILSALGPVFALVLLGYLLGRAHFPHRDFWPQAERFTYYFLFPALLVLKLGQASLPSDQLARVALLLLLLLLLSSALVLILARLGGLGAAAQSSVLQGGVRFNTYVGLASASALFGDAGLVWGAVFLGVMIPSVNVVCVTGFTLLLRRTDQPLWRLLWRGVATNPLIIACVLGGALNLTGIGIPAPVVPVLQLISSMALPLGLLAVGVGLDFRLLRQGGLGLWLACGFKLLLYPLLFLGLALLLGVPADARSVLLLFALLPTAPSAYILARQLGGDAPLMAAIITLQTLLAIVSMPLLLGVLGSI